jgi:hypothetical protein
MINKSLRDRAKEMGNSLPIMEGREKGELDRLINTTATIRDYGFLTDESIDGQTKIKTTKDYVCFIVDEDPQHFYFGGQVLTDNMHEFELDGYHDAIVAEGLPVLFGKKKSKNKGENGVPLTYTTVTFYPEND